MRNNLVTDYVLPTRIILQSDNIKNAKALLLNREEQIFLKESEFLSCRGKGFIILDFGKELCGGVRLLSYRLEGQKALLKIRLRFGESVGETCAELGEKNAVNDHSVRDFVTILPDLSDQEWGDTGFRFVRIDFLDEDKEYRLVNVYAASRHRDLAFNGDFKSDDTLIDSIFNTARYTLYLTMQQNLIEGIKRDRLVWIGDMQPQVLGITDIFGQNDIVEKSVKMSVDKNPLPSWFGNIPTYSFWFIQILYDYYLKVNNKDFVLDLLPYVEGVLKQLDDCIDENGNIDFSKNPADARNGFFLDWPTRFTPDAEAGNSYVFIYVTSNCKRLYRELGLKPIPLCDIIINKLRRKKFTEVRAKQVVALGFLAGEIQKNEAAEKLVAGGAKGLSTFLSYYILRAIAESAGMNCALDILKEYYGGMLSRGATTFWEDFNVEWLENSGRIDELTDTGKKDLHGDFGDFCYTGFRHSLCHGWSCGPIQFLLEYVAGIKVLAAGCKKIEISPDLGYLKSCSVTFPTPYGNMKVEHNVENGTLNTVIDAPKEIKILKK